jgi:hypothetical protein
MTRAEAAQAFGEPVTMATRPAGGWPEREDTLEQVGPFARRHEQEHGVTAQTCEVRRSTTNPMAFGTLHYFLYGPDDRLLEHHARFLD